MSEHIRDELPPLHEMIPEVEGPTYEWKHQMWLTTTLEERMWMRPDMLVRIGHRVFELLESVFVPSVGVSWLVRPFKTHLTDEELADLSGQRRQGHGD